MHNGQRHEAGPLLARGRLVTVDGHPVCAECGTAVAPQDAGQWEHVPEGVPYPRRTRWFSPVTWAELRGMRSYRDFTRATRGRSAPSCAAARSRPRRTGRRACGGCATTTGSSPPRGGCRRPRPGENPYLDLVHVLAGGPRLAWAARRAGCATCLTCLPGARKLAGHVRLGHPGRGRTGHARPDSGRCWSAVPGPATGRRCSPVTGPTWLASDLAGSAEERAPPPGDGSQERNSGHRPWAEVRGLDAAQRGARAPGPDLVPVLAAV